MGDRAVYGPQRVFVWSWVRVRDGRVKPMDVETRNMKNKKHDKMLTSVLNDILLFYRETETGDLSSAVQLQR